MEHDTKVAAVKGASAWGAVGLANLGLNTWGDAAAMLAAIYSLVLICEWVWKRALRPLLEDHGVVKAKPARVHAETDNAPL